MLEDGPSRLGMDAGGHSSSFYSGHRKGWSDRDGFLFRVLNSVERRIGWHYSTILAVIALLKSMGKEILQMGSAAWHWKGWAIVPKSCRKVNTLYRVRTAKNVMRRTLEEQCLRIPIRVYENCLRKDPSKATRIELEAITPAKPLWLNDYYVATALESLSNEGNVLRARRYSANSWPPTPDHYDFEALSADESACEEAVRRSTIDKCAAYQNFNLCPRPPRFERKETGATVSPRETRLETTYALKHMAPPCGLCWEKERRERDIRSLVDNITRYDLAGVATVEVTGTNRELQEAIAKTCIEGQCPAEVGLIKLVVEQAINIRQRQLECCTSRLQHEWRQDNEEELVAKLREYISRQTTQ